uniref:Secreted protein n=1 Tax=Ascaris lumbricoides TaxID=6252 RepID=A0A0M3HRB2_ASCLU
MLAITVLVLTVFTARVHSANESHPFCYSWEPCRYTLRAPRIESVSFFVNVDTWCRCRSDENCERTTYDARKRALVSYCRKAETASVE